MARGSKVLYPPDKFMADWAWSSENFWSKVTKTDDDECWPWTGSTGPMGPLFGARKLKADGNYGPQMTQARRIAWAEHHGSYLRPQQNIFHSCGNKNCVNPRHLTEEKIVKPREERLHMGRKPGSRLANGRVYGPDELDLWAAQQTQGAN